MPQSQTPSNPLRPQSISSWVEERLNVDESLSTEAQMLVLAALEGSQSLADLIDDGTPVRFPAERAEGNTPAGAFIKRIEVRAFRGIGPSTALDLAPGPGLTIVAGRNGSGKSSFAEGLEVALTGSTYRFTNKRSVQWEDGWRNLHNSESPLVTVTFAEVNKGATRVVASWADGAELADVDVSVKRPGAKDEQGIAALGWETAVETHRPMLSYDELGTLLAGKPSDLYDALSKVLGLERISEAVTRLTETSKRINAPGTELGAQRSALIDRLADIDDRRASTALTLVRARIVDDASLRTLATGADPDDSSVVGWLRQLLTITLAPLAEVIEASDALVSSVETMAALADDSITGLDLRSEALIAAIRVHEHGGDQACPVCGEGTLDDRWSDGTRTLLADLAQQLSAVRTVQSDLGRARDRALNLTRRPVPSALMSNQELLSAEIAAVNECWHALRTSPAGDLALANHLLTAWANLETAVVALHAVARPELDRRDDVWSAVATHIGSFADACGAWGLQKPQAEAAKKALSWLKDHELILKNDRLKPIAEQAAQIWTELRQESNVDISGLTFEGSTTRRRVAIGATVDGYEAPGLAVMSQGELHALALALFLPRATLPDSPFRFVVLDDPVQAMDPSKIDGLVKTLERLAVDRQVIVFSHDDRLPQAARRGTNATIVEVTRHKGSRVEVHDALTPAKRYLDDARAIANDPLVPDATLRRVLPTLLRLGLESQAFETYAGRVLGKGGSLQDLEAAWDAAQGTAKKLALALYDEIRPLDAWLAKRPHRSRGLGVCTSGAHGSLHGDPRLASEDVEKMVADLVAGTK